MQISDDELEILKRINLKGVAVFREDPNEKFDSIYDPEEEATVISEFAMRLNRIKLTDLKDATQYFIHQVSATREGKAALKVKRQQGLAKRVRPPTYKALFLATDISKVVTISGDTVTVGEGDECVERAAFWGSVELPLSFRKDIPGLKIKSLQGTFNANVFFDSPEGEMMISNPGNATIGPKEASESSSSREKKKQLHVAALEQQLADDGLELLELEEANAALEGDLADAKRELAANGSGGSQGSQTLGQMSLRTELLALPAVLIKEFYNKIKEQRSGGMPNHGPYTKARAIDAILSEHFS